MDDSVDKKVLTMVNEWLVKHSRVAPSSIPIDEFISVAVEYTLTEEKPDVSTATAAVIGAWLLSHTTPLFTRTDKVLVRIGTKHISGVAPYTIASVAYHFGLPVDELKRHIAQLIGSGSQ